MDAASKIKTFLVALAAAFGTAAMVHSDDAAVTPPCKSKECQTTAGLATPCIGGVCCDGQVCEAGKCSTVKCPSGTAVACDSCGSCDAATPKKPAGIAAFVSDWLTKSPKFSAEVAIHFGAAPHLQNKPSESPVGVYVQEGQTGRYFNVARSFNSELEVTREFVLEERNFDLLNRSDDSLKSVSRVAVPQIAKPMRFTERIPRIQFGDLGGMFGDVIICGHRICSGNKCYDVKDEPVAGMACDKNGDSNVNANENGEEEQILVLPMAPPAPPGVNIAFNGNGIIENESEAASILRNSGLGNVNISLPVTTVVDLLVAKTEFSTRLEMTSQLMDERQQAMQQIQSLANRNATLSTQLAVAEARNHMSEALTASVVDRAELAIKLASVESKSAKLQGSSNVVQTIQEDLTNIRRQIALLRRSPVPFAQSYVGIQPYVPTAQLPASQLSKDVETTCAGDEPASPAATTVK